MCDASPTASEVTMARSLWLGVLAVVLLAAEFNSARADIPGPWPWSRAHPFPHGGTDPTLQNEIPDPARVPPAPQPIPPRRTGPFRSCGSGMGLGLAGIGVAWGMFWLGSRFVGRVSRRTSERNR
jgi:hypothetical protein